MIRKHTSREIIAALCLSFVLGASTCGLAINAAAQSPSTKSKTAAPTNAHETSASPRVYEDEEVKIQIPAGWIIAISDHHAPPSANEGGAQKNSTLLLLKNGYTLSLAYDTSHASGVDGGRFIELFTVPWLETEAAWNCSGSMVSIPQPASRTLMLLNLTLRTGDPKVREICGIPKNLGHWTNTEREKNYVGEQRWFAAYFTTAGQGWFFPSEGATCGEKAYTLTSMAKTPDELPAVDDPKLKAVINEAIDIVYSIHYKRCPPSNTNNQ